MDHVSSVLAAHVITANLPDYRSVRCCGTCVHGTRGGSIVTCRNPTLGVFINPDGVAFQNYTYTRTSGICDDYKESE
jgi:hypothetical protein